MTPSTLSLFNQRTRERIGMLSKVEACVFRAITSYLDKEGFIQVFPPHLTKYTGACENLSTVFQLSFYNQYAILAQTKQLFLELLVPELKKVWCFGPSFRAEPTVDRRHLTEFILIEMEFLGDLAQLMKHIENMVHGVISNAIEEDIEQELQALNVDIHRLKRIEGTRFPIVSYDEAVVRLGLEWGSDLKSQHEMRLLKFYGERPLFITHYPRDIKFFNMKTNSQNPKVVNSVDLILPFSGEAVGGAEREYRYEEALQKLKCSSMLKQMEARGRNSSEFEWYLENLKRNGSLPHAGCGIGLSRITQFILRSNDIRQATVFPLNKETLM